MMCVCVCVFFLAVICEKRLEFLNSHWASATFTFNLSMHQPLEYKPDQALIAVNDLKKNIWWSKFCLWVSQRTPNVPQTTWSLNWGRWSETQIRPLPPSLLRRRLCSSWWPARHLARSRFNCRRVCFQSRSHLRCSCCPAFPTFSPLPVCLTNKIKAHQTRPTNNDCFIVD